MANSPFEKLAFIHHHRLQKGKQVLDKAAQALNRLRRGGDRLDRDLQENDALLAEADELLAKLSSAKTPLPQLAAEADRLAAPCRPLPPVRRPEFERLDVLDEADDLDALLRIHKEYAARHQVDCERRLDQLLSREGVAALRKQLEDEFTYKQPRCDALDYMIAGTSGLLGGLVDIFLVGAPGTGYIGALSDKAADTAVQGFAKLCGWTPNEGSDPTKSAIGFLERTFKVGYDHRHSVDVGQAFRMSASNHHLKSLSHSPDLLGLFTAILTQFTGKAYFASGGSLFSVDAAGELCGGTAASKIFAGFVNWVGHLFSDVAGSSGASARGSGIPIPFFNLLQFVNVGQFGQHRQDFATICTKVFEQGYDFRHGMALAVPVLLVELMVRVMHMVKRHFVNHEKLELQTALRMTPELQRMLFVAHGVLCLMDAGDAALRSNGNLVTYLLHTNLIAWVRFGLLAYKEMRQLLKCGHIDAGKLDAYLETEYQRLLASPI